MKIKLLRATYFLALALFVVSMNFGASNVSVAQAGNDGKTTICHSTASDTNPYVVITISNNAVAKHLEEHKGNERGLRADFVINNAADLARCLGTPTPPPPTPTHTPTRVPPTPTHTPTRVPPTSTPTHVAPTATPHA